MLPVRQRIEAVGGLGVLNPIYDWNPVVTMALCSALFVGMAWLAAVFLRPRLAFFLKGQPELNFSVGYFLSFFNLVDGLLLSLLAVATYQNHANVERIVVREAVALTSLYRDVSTLPDSVRSTLQGILHDYTRDIVEVAWPRHRLGETSNSGTAIMDEFQKQLVAFEPQTRRQEILFEAAFRQFNQYIEARQLRRVSVRADMPAILWYAVGVGIIIHSIFLNCLDIRLRTYLLFATLISLFTATVICMIALLDHPFRGPFGVSAEPFAELLDYMLSREELAEGLRQAT
jgi:Protein of unknown function (DUF4239)